MTDIQEKICSTCKRAYRKAEDFYQGTSRWRLCEAKNLWFNCNCGSTLMLKSGKYDWYNPSKGMSKNAASIFNSLPALNNLPRISSTVMKLQQSLQIPEIEISVLAKQLRRDPLIAASILTIANNLKSNRSPGDKKKIESIEHAAMYVGKKTLEDLVLTSSLQSFKSETKVFNIDDFWRESFLMGGVAEATANHLKIQVNRDELFLAASLCNIGKFVGAISFPDVADIIQSDVSEPKTLSTWQVAEKNNHSLDHCVLGEIGASIWGLPIYVADAASKHHTFNSSTKQFGINELVTFANQMTHWILLRPSRIDQPQLNSI
ncbi:MAG: HDOD domain-containing protein, partial [Proteobacteria bacterium]|nr:HDOD domain-containing protein [Pseudomonadota bacterium]